ncbi:Protein of unknown function [Proteiniborus ethanoligenes]|uniref:DUF4446 domain-containing protein n=1 Tax=Proteiniborus ethanoligenes TaxID=415015 RepID=A0A1H3NG47_9FIRM|nr:DUF4446 family protein [Proteiniborus ethanoligenes]SDY87901.1 Protein of unknown function [Proteiniborus ethanoligenes]
MEFIFNFFTEHIVEIVIVMSLFNVLLLLLYIIRGIRISSITKKYNRLVGDSDTNSLETILLNYIDEIKDAKGEMLELKKYIENLNDRLELCLQRIGFIRYNAFNDMGSDLSFSIALLDDKLDGFVITSIYGRDESNTYAKPILKGESTYPLSVEEMQALDRAKRQSLSR